MPATLRLKSPKRRHKYGAHACYRTPDGNLWDAEEVQWFASRKEAERYKTLMLMERGGLIRELRRQVEYVVGNIGGRLVKYVADFVYVDVASGETVVEDVKSAGTRTRDYLRKKAAMLSEHGITIRET